MNFLLHHRLASAELGSEVAGIGAMLPDLWRMADRRVRPARDGVARSSGALEEVLRGVAHHVEIDRWFHAAPVFVEGERRTLAAIRGSGSAAPRLPLFAHVLWEMCLDGALLRREGLEATLEALRRGFGESAGAPLERAAELHHFERLERSDDDRAAFRRRIIRICEEIARGPWIDGYQDGFGIADRLAGVRARLGIAPMIAEDRERLAAAMDGLTPSADEAVDRMLRERIPLVPS